MSKWCADNTFSLLVLGFPLAFLKDLGKGFLVCICLETFIDIDIILASKRNATQRLTLLTQLMHTVNKV